VNGITAKALWMVTPHPCRCQWSSKNGLAFRNEKSENEFLLVLNKHRTTDWSAKRS